MKMEEPGFVSGITVVNLNDVRVARGMTRRHHSSCPHNSVLYDEKERRVWCQDCETDVEAFDAFMKLVEQHDSAWQKLSRLLEEAKEARMFQIRRIVTKRLDKIWRSKTRVPCCPHCEVALLPEDFQGRIKDTGKRFEIARRNKSRD